MATAESIPVPTLLSQSFTARLVWTAGFLEGEGHFDASYSGIKIKAVQIQRAPLEWLQLFWGGSLTLSDKASRRKIGRKPIWDWALHGMAGRGLIMTLYPLLSPWRREQVRKALTVWRRRPKSWRYRTACPQGHSLTRIVIRKQGGKRPGIHRSCAECKRRWNRDYQRRKSGRWGRRHLDGLQDGLRV
jgi:hypothetical protein